MVSRIFDLFSDRIKSSAAFSLSCQQKLLINKIN